MKTQPTTVFADQIGDALTDSLSRAALDAVDTLRIVASLAAPDSDLADPAFDAEVLAGLLMALGVLPERKAVDPGSTSRPGTVHCAMCGQEHSRRSLWCSERCRRRDRRALHSFWVAVRTDCEWCRKPLTARRSNKRFCSGSCRKSAWKASR